MDSFQETHARLLQDTSIQFERHATQAIEPSMSVPPSIPSLGVIEWVFWTTIALILCGIVVAVLHRLSTRPNSDGNGRAFGMTKVTTTTPAAVTLPAGALPEADALAGDGNYGEAVHVLLLRGVAAIDRRFPRALAPFHTSRDIAGLDVLPELVRTAFGGIAERTERAIFACRDLTRDEWLSCRALYAGLTKAARH